MSKTEFQRKVKAVFPDKTVKFECNTVANHVWLEGFMLHNMVHSEAVYIYWPDGNSAGRSEAVENA